MRFTSTSATLLVASLSSFFVPAQAVTIAGFNYDAVVGSSVSPLGQRWAYSFAVNNQTNETFCCLPPLIKDFSLPYFSDAGIADISEPSDWSFEILSGNKFGLQGADTLHWTTSVPASEIRKFGPAGVFGFTANYAAAKGPFVVAFTDFGSFSGDPAVPASPLALAAGLVPITSVPEPSSSAMLLLGLMIVGGNAVWRSRSNWRRRGTSAATTYVGGGQYLTQDAGIR